MPSDTERLQDSIISRINDVLHHQCIKYALKVANDCMHRLLYLVPLKNYLKEVATVPGYVTYALRVPVEPG